MARLLRSHDWAESGLGTPDTWPAELITMVNFILGSPLPMQILWGPEMRILYNDALLPFVTGKHPQALGQAGHIVWKEVWPTVGEQLTQVMRDGQSLNFHNLLLPILRNGVLEDIYWNYSYSPVYAQDGTVLGILDVAQDVTAAMVAQQHLRASEARATRILRSIGDAVIVTDAATRVSRMNPIAEALTGWKEAEAAGQPLGNIFNIVNETTRQVVESPADKVKRTGTIAGLANHTILIAKDGTETQIDDSGAPIRDDDGKLSGIVLVFRDIGERRKVEREREGATEQLLQVLGATSDAVVSVNRDWVMTYLNPMAEKLYGPSKNVVGRRVWDAFPDAVFEGSPFVEHYYRAMDEGIAGGFETYYPEPLNFWLRLDVYPTRDGIVTFSSDISAEKQASEKLREQDERLRMALTATKTVGTWDWDVPNNRIYVQDEFSKFYGVDAKMAAEGLPLQDFTRDVHPDDQARLNDALETALRTGDDYVCEYRLMQADGSVRWVSSAGRCKFGPDGKAARFPGVTVDITEMRRNVEALRMSEESLRIAAMTARLGTFDVDLATGRMEASALCKANYGWPEDEPFRYQDLLSRVHPEDRPDMVAARSKAIATGEDYRVEYRVVWPDGTVHWLRASGRVVQNAAPGGVPSPLRFTGVTLDVTERHLAQAALIQGEKLAAVGKLAASIAHEINNPLESVTNLLYLAQHAGEISPQAREYLETADRELRRVSIISSQTLRFYKQSTSPKPVTCNDLFSSVLSIFQGRLVNSQVNVIKRKRANMPVLCFENEIRQVLNNLVGNAIDAMHPRGGKLYLRSRDAINWKAGERGLLVTIADTGPGIDPAVLKHIFEAFYTTKGIGGTGLGLWVSREIVDRHRGVLNVRSRQHAVHHGTVFTLFLPQDAVDRQGRESSASESDGNAASVLQQL